MSNVIAEAMQRKKKIAEKLYERADIQQLRGLMWDRFLREIPTLPLPEKVDQIVACDLYDMLNPQQATQRYS